MNRTSSPTLRLFWALLALVQLGVTAVGPLVDGVLEDRADPVVHVESESGEDCGTHHDHLFCQVCRTVALAGLTSPSASAPTPWDSPEISPAATSTDLPSPPGLFSPVGSRAPPRA